jgi:hypothetical protein
MKRRGEGERERRGEGKEGERGRGREGERQKEGERMEKWLELGLVERGSEEMWEGEKV